jgi:hypothetical protein
VLSAYGISIIHPMRKRIAGRSIDRPRSKQRLDERAFRQRAISTLCDYVLQHPLHAFQIGNLRPHITEMSCSDGARLGTRLIAFVDETWRRFRGVRKPVLLGCLVKLQPTTSNEATISTMGML